MPTITEVTEQCIRLQTYRERLATYLQQLAIVGFAHARPELLSGIREARQHIAHIKGVLQQWQVACAEHPDDEEGISMQNGKTDLLPNKGIISPPSIPSMVPRRILIVDREIAMQQIVTRLVRACCRDQDTIVTRSFPEEALPLLEAQTVHVLITESSFMPYSPEQLQPSTPEYWLRQQRMSGFDLVEQGKRYRPDLFSIMLSGWPKEFLEMRAALYQVNLLLAKPFAAEDLMASVHYALQRIEGSAPPNIPST
jgi:CheY-like chemotaxis protein